MDVVVVGAGLAGLVAARRLVAAGHSVVVFDKGRSPGGRLATRRIGTATLDHGAQFFTARSPAFTDAVAGWQAEGLVVEWCRGFGGDDGHPRYRVEGGMHALAKRLADELDVRCDSLVFALRRDPRGTWQVQLDDAAIVDADAVVLTCPVPQSLSLAISADVDVPAELVGFDYDPTLCLLAVLDAASGVPAPGGVQDADVTFSFVADNALKGVSAVPALTLHATAQWSRDHLDTPTAEVHAALVAAAAPWIGEAQVIESQVKRWRYATPVRTWPAPCLALEGGPGPLVLAGDAYAGPKVEGAYTSGLAAAATLIA